MNPDRLLALYEKIAEAPDAFPRLRRFVLDLAVRGKLVEQDPNDEPAAELLKRVRAAKASLVKAGVARKPRAISPLDQSDLPFSVPSGWVWTQLGQLGLVSPRNEAEDDLEASFVPMSMIAAEYGVSNRHEVRSWGHIKKGYTHFAEGDVGLAKITPCFENGKSTVFRDLTGGIGAGTTELHVIRPILMGADYIVTFLKSPQFIEVGIPRMTGTAGQKRVPADYFAGSPFPLPPLAEQRRIVAKVEELMGLLDRLEAARQRREETRDRLTVSSLARLTAPEAEPETFPTHARFALDSLPALTTRPDQIKQLRQTILNLAVQGRLEEQIPSDEPISEVLEQWLNEKLSGLTKGKRTKLLEAWRAVKSSPPNELPPSWIWVTAEEICEEIVDCPHSTPKFAESGIACLDTNSVKSSGLLYEKLRFVSEETSAVRNKRLIPRPGDVVFAREGSVGETVIVPAGLKCCLGQRVMLFRPSPVVSSEWFKLAISEPSALRRLLTLHKGIGAKHVNVRDMRMSLQPLPPLAEQHRIVAKVDALMALCDQLEAALTTAETSRTRLLAALLHEALAETAPEREAA